jgi:hypothetical protein
MLVVDVHHKLYGLISLPSYHLSQVHKVQHKPRKKLSWDSTKFGAKTSNGATSGAPDTVRCLGRAPPELATLGFIRVPLRYNAPDMSGEPTEQRSNASTVDCVNSKNVHNAEVRSQSYDIRTHRTCPVCHRTIRCSKRTKDFNGQPLETPTVY